MTIDAFCFAGHWPFRDVPFESAPLKWMDAEGIDEALVIPMDALFRIDALATARPFARLCARSGGRLHLVAPVNPSLPGWDERLEALIAKSPVPALALFPSYHLYDVSAECVEALMLVAQKHDLPVCVALRVEDRRKQHPLMQVPDVPAAQVIEVARRHPEARVVLLGANNGEARAAGKAHLGNVFIEISGMELLDPLSEAVESVGADRVLFGTRAPLFVPRSSALKVKTSAAAEDIKRQVLSENARRLFRLRAAGPANRPS